MIIDPEASLSEKLLGYSTISIALLIVLSVPGFYADFLPSQEYLSKSRYLTIALSLILIVTLLIGFIIKPEKLDLPVVIMFCALIVTSSYCFIMLSAPYFLHQFSNTPSHTASFLVVGKNSEYFKSRPRCNGGIYIRHDAFLKNQVCGLPRDLWQEIRSGDVVELSGTKSYFGLDYASFRIAGKSNDKP